MTTDVDPYDRLARYIARVVAQQPVPPRRVRSVDIFEFVIGLRGAATLLGPAVIFVTAAFVALIWPGISPIRVALGLVVAPMAGVVLARPFLTAFRLLFALRRGAFTSALVTHLGDPRRGVAGRCDVRTEEGTFEAAFDLAAPWAQQLRVGATMVALAHPTKQRVLWFVGLPHA